MNRLYSQLEIHEDIEAYPNKSSMAAGLDAEERKANSWLRALLISEKPRVMVSMDFVVDLTRSRQRKIE